MSNLKKVPYLAKSVELHEDYILDNQLHAKVPINETTNKILQLVDGRKSVSEITEEANKEFKINYDVLYKDVNNLLDELNKNYLLNWKYISNKKMQKILINFIAQYKKGYKERTIINNSSFFSAFNSINNLVIKKIGIFFVWTLILYILSKIIYITSENSSTVRLALNFSLGVTIAFIGLILSTSLHEISHVYSFWIQKRDKTIGFMGVSPFGVRFVRPVEKDPKINIIVSLSGPLIPGILGILMYLISATLLKEWQYNSQANIFAAMFILQLIHCLPFTGDGKNVVKQIMIMRYRNKII
ncbi:PqqD family peptide modification chaperone [Clostridium frigidicarnis]|uniref:Zn-dependent protease (Includes SpoIVFB) n=1 Tax=Clostridium frigidicarnis TaxID=84698 RepID=A0A1I0Y8I7_9CLOT|nr:PqqD family peptide modification chaperone [Clostridium frigidicarnis]SFB08473.1 Zn-dependent protease (includes SpoIVFB) [Clostridium frigidicarnis]